MLTFASPFFLWGLLGLAAPVLIHLINRDLFRPLVFPSIQFILRGKLPVERKRRLRDWLLLALRMLLFAALVTALARPQWQPEMAPTATATEEGELVILLDASASMGGWNSWPAAVAQAQALLDQHQPAPAAIVVSGFGPVAIEPTTREYSRLRSFLGQATPQPVAGDHRESLRQALRLLSGQTPATLAVISDFQQSDWSPSSLPPIDPQVELQWFPVSPGPRENAAVLHARALPLPDGRRQVVAEIKNFGLESTSRTVQLRTGDESLSRPLDLSPGETRSVSFILEQPSSSQAEVSIEADAFPTDDRYFLWLSRPPPIQVVIIAPTADEPESMEELFFLSRALTTRTDTQWLHFAVAPVEPAQLTADSLRGAQAVFLLGAAPYLNPGHWQLLHQHLAEGGRLLFTPGKAPARQTTLLAEQGLIRLSYEGMAGIDRRQPRPHSIDWVRPDSPIDLLFRAEDNRSLSHVSIYQYVRLAAPGGREGILLRTSQDDPVLLQQAVGPGLVFATAFPFQTAWTDLPVSTAFLPIIRELVAGDLRPDHGIVNLDTAPTTALIGSRLNLPATSPAMANLDPLVPGIHVVGGTPVVLNAPRSESLPGVTLPVDLQTAATPRPHSLAGAAPASDRGSRISLWPALALAALLFFILEMPLAARLRRSPPTGPAAPPRTTSGTVT
jgi:hypothetical protein